MTKHSVLKGMFITVAMSAALLDFSKSFLMSRLRSEDNSFASGSLEISLQDEAGESFTDSFFEESDFKPGDSESKILQIHKAGTLDFKYDVDVKIESDDIVLCQKLDIEAKREGEEKYKGKLTEFDISSSSNINGDNDSWQFIISLEDDNPDLRNKKCEFYIEIRAKQVDSDGTWGLTDKTKIFSKVESGTWEPQAEPFTTDSIISVMEVETSNTIPQDTFSEDAITEDPPQSTESIQP